MFYFDYYYLVLVVPAMILALVAQGAVKGSYSKYSKVRNYKGITGAQAARMVLDSKGLTNVRIEPVAGTMTDHFDPRTNVIRLSEGVYNTASVAAVGIAAHEAGHAIQHAENYFPNKVRSALVPVVNFRFKFLHMADYRGITVTAEFYMDSSHRNRSVCNFNTVFTCYASR